LSCTVQVANHRKAIGPLYAGVQTAANAGVPEDQAGLAAALITASFQLGSALGLAVFSGIATSRTGHVLTAPNRRQEIVTSTQACLAINGTHS
jgi:predicted MFS family arabinose efflux permease